MRKFDKIQLWAGVIIMVVFSGFAAHISSDAAGTAQRAADVAEKTAQQGNAAFCKAAVPSWIVRNQLIIDTNEHSALSSVIDPKSDIGKSLQAQIDHVNKQRDVRKARDTALNGTEPCQ